GDVVWLRFDYYENGGGATAQLSWQRPNGNSGSINELIPASALFLSESVARGRTLQEPQSGEAIGTAFTLFANQSTASALSVGLGFSTSSGTTTINAGNAHRRAGDSDVRDDYGLYNDIYATQLLPSPLPWQPSGSWTSGSSGISRDIYSRVFSDIYAEANENVQLTLQAGTGYGVASNTLSIPILDQPLTLSIEAVQNPSEGEAGWVTIRSRINDSLANNPFAGGLPVSYQITGGSAVRGSDYFAPQATLSTTSFKAEDLVLLPAQASETKLYISALADAIREGDETIELEIQPRTESNSSGFEYQRYLVDSSRASTTVTLADSSSWTAGVALTPADRTGTATIRATVASNGQQQASLDVHLLSQPRADVTVSLVSSSGSLSAGTLTFTPANWSTPQRVSVSNLRSDATTSINVSATSSGDSYYDGSAVLRASQTIVPAGWPTDLGLTLWEGGAEQARQPLVSLRPVDGAEGSTGVFGVDLLLDAPQMDAPLEVLYTLSPGSGFQLSGTDTDAALDPERAYQPLTLPAGGTGHVNLGDLTSVGASGAFSAEAWVRPDAMSYWPAVLEFADGAGVNEILLGFNNKTLQPSLHVYTAKGQQVGNLTAAAGDALSLGQWSHLAFSIDANRTASLYVNGRTVASGSLSEAPLSRVRSYNWVGKSAWASDTNNGYLHGAVRDARVWNSARTTAQIQASMTATKASGSGLIGGWSFNNANAGPTTNAAGGPAAALKQQAAFASATTYGVLIPVGSDRAAVRLTPVDDDSAEGRESLTLSLVASGRYSTTSSSLSSTATLGDNDTAALTFSLLSANGAWITTADAVVNEDDATSGRSTTLGLSLASRPSAAVSVTLDTASFNAQELQISGPGSPPSLSFTPDNWSVPQTLQLRGVDDGSSDGDITQLVSFRLSSTDSAYAALVPALAITTVDDDALSADPALAEQGAGSGPLASFSTPSRSSVGEGSSDASTVQVGLSAAASVDTLVFFDLNRGNNGVSDNDVLIKALSGSSSLSGLTRLQKASTATGETAQVDGDGINETGATFNSMGLSGAFNVTWSGWVRIDQSGWYTFSTAVQGGVRLSLDGQRLIDKWFDQASTWSTASLYLERGSFLALTLDYQASTSQDPKIALRWTRPSANGGADVQELVPASRLQRVNGLHLLMPAGSSAAQFSVQANDDQVAEGVPGGNRSEQLLIDLLETRSVEVQVVGEGAAATVGSVQLTLALGRTPQESLSLAAGTVLSLGPDSNSSSTARFTLAQAITLHRDRSTAVAGQLTAADGTSPFSGTATGLVGSVATGAYQVLDPAVTVLASDNWQPNQAGATSGEGTVSLALAATNRSSVTLAAGTVLSYSRTGADGSSEPLLDLTLREALTLSPPANGATSGQAKTVKAAATNRTGNSSVPAIAGLAASATFANPAQLSITDNDTPGIQISSDAAGANPVNLGAVIQLTEQGQSQQRWLRLTSQPTETGTVYLETGDTSELLLVPASGGTGVRRRGLSFTPETWATPQAFSLQGQDDRLDDGDIDVTVHTRTASNDAFYAIRDTGVTLKARVADDDSAGVTLGLVPSSLSRGGNGFLSLQLSAQPSADVAVTLTPADDQFTINNRSIGRPETLTFTADNWSVARQVQLRAVDDQAVEDVTRSQLTFSTSSSDARFQGLSVTPLPIDIVDNDLPTASLELASNSTEEAAPGRFRIRLSAPTATSAGADGLLVGYTVNALTLDPGLGYGSGTSALGKVVQSPPAVSGQVRIPPGSSSADVWVVPIDDFVADNTDKQFVVSLSSGSGYRFSSGDPSTSATVTILNNDKAGVAIITTGSRALATEGNSTGGQFQVVLLSQPTSSVTITLQETGNPAAGSSTRQLGDASAAYQRSLTFTSANWFTPQVVTVTARDDNKIAGVDETEDPSRPNTGLHTAQISYSFSSGDANYNSTSHSTEPNHFTNTVQTVDVMDRPLPTSTATSLDSSLTSLQEGIESLSLPIVGSLDGKVGSGFRRFLSGLVQSVSAAGTPSPSNLKKLIADGIGIAQDHVSLSMRGSNVAVAFTFSDEEDLFSIPLAADLGLPALGFQSQGSLDAGYSYDAQVTLEFSPKGDISLDTDPEQTYVHANYTTALSDDFSFTGGLGFLQLEAINQPTVNETIIEQAGEAVATGLNVDFTLDLNGGAGADGRLTLEELTNPSTSFEELFQYSLSGDAALSMGITTSVGGSAAIPSFSFDLATLLPLFDYSNQEESEAEEASTSIFFDNIKLDLGTFITGMLKPVVDGIDSILNPLYPIVDALYSDTQIFSSIGLAKSFDQDGDNRVSAIDLAQWFAGFYATIDPAKGEKLEATINATVEFLDVVKGVMDLVRDLDAMAEEGSFYVDFGSYELPALKAGSQE
ncbi:MAG: LamG-like jellyroll fold domain-containing protein, partial [Cyanobacteriota bacterium]